MIDLKKLEVWFVTGSQHLYGEETLKQVAEHSQIIAKALHGAVQIPVTIIYKPIVTTPEEIYRICVEANTTTNCIGIIPWNDIDMNFMNLNQSAHGDREFGFIMSRMRLRRKVIVGHWQDMKVLERI